MPAHPRSGALAGLADCRASTGALGSAVLRAFHFSARSCGIPALTEPGRNASLRNAEESGKVAPRFGLMRNSGSSAATTEATRWGGWLTEHGAKLLLFARQQTRRQEDAEDILQEALVKLARKEEEGSFFGGQDAWLPFLYTQIRREAIDLGRRNDRRQKREDAVAEREQIEHDGDLAWFESAGYQDERRRMLERSLRELPRKFSEVIVMKIWGGRTFAEIGEILDITMNTVASRYRYGIEALRKRLAGARIRGDL